MAYQPGVYRTSGGDEQVVASSGRLYVNGGTLQLSTSATLTLAGQTVTTTGGVAGSSGTFTADIAITSGISASTGVFTGGVQLSSTLTAIHGTFSSSITVAANVTITSGLNGTTGQFSSGIGALQITLTSGVTASGGAISGQRGYVHFVETATSSWASIAAYGLSIIKSTESAPHLYALAAPVAGMEKVLVCPTVTIATGSSTGAAIVTSSGAGAGHGSNTSILFSTGNAQTPQWVRLIGQNSTNWLVVGYSTDVSFSAT